MRYPGADLNFWQRTSVDVVAFLAVAIYVVFKVLILIVKLAFSTICGLCRSKKDEKKTKKVDKKKKN